jgi:hypothetical protein
MDSVIFSTVEAQFFLILASHDIQKRLPASISIHLLTCQLECPPHELRTVSRHMRRDQQIGRASEGMSGRKRLGIGYIESCANSLFP